MWSREENEKGISAVNFCKSKNFKKETKIVFQIIKKTQRKETWKDMRSQGLQKTIYKTYRYTVPWRDCIIKQVLTM